MDDVVVAENMTAGLGALDVTVVAAAVGALFVIAWISGRKEKDTADFFVARRSIPAVIACLSFVATEVSAVTIIGVPSTGYTENWQYLQFFLGSAAARILIAFLFIPVFFKFNVTTIYEFLKHRFGAATQYSGSAFFFVTRLMASGVRLYAACLGVAVILGWDASPSWHVGGWTVNSGLVAALGLFTLCSIAFIAFGGIKAVVWTGAFATTIFFLAGGAVAVYLWRNIHLDFGAAWQGAHDAGRTSLLNTGAQYFTSDTSCWGGFVKTFADPNTLWAATLNAFFVGLCVFGTDQELMQRLLTVRTRRSSQKALIGTILAAFPLVTLYLGLGTLLFLFYHQHPSLPPPENSDKILSHFVVNVLPAGLKGLVLAAVVLASIDSPLSSLSSSFVTDIYRPLICRDASERHYLWVSRCGIVGFGILLAILALAFSALTGILWLAFKVIAVTGGSTLGIFLLGLLTKRRGNMGNVIAMVASSVVTATLLVLSETKVISLGWSWLIVIGTILTFAIGYALGKTVGDAAAPAHQEPS